MPEAVIVSTARTPIGRANKGSLTECRPDDLAGFIIKTVLEKTPQLDPQLVEDVILGCGQPGGEAGYNVGRVAALLAGLPDVPGVTVNRYCSSSLQTIRMAAHAIKSGEGDVFVAAGVECVSRFDKGRSDGVVVNSLVFAPETSSLPNDVMSMIPARSRIAVCSTATRSWKGGRRHPNVRCSSPARRDGSPGANQSARSQPFFVPNTAPSSCSRPCSGLSRRGLPASDTSYG